MSQYMAAIKSGLSGKKAASWKELSLELCYQLPDSAVDQFVTHLLLSSPPSVTQGNMWLWWTRLCAILHSVFCLSVCLSVCMLLFWCRSLSGDCVLWGVMGKAGLERPSVRHSLLHRNLFMRWYKEV